MSLACRLLCPFEPAMSTSPAVTVQPAVAASRCARLRSPVAFKVWLVIAVSWVSRPEHLLVPYICRLHGCPQSSRNRKDEPGLRFSYEFAAQVQLSQSLLLKRRSAAHSLHGTVTSGGSTSGQCIGVWRMTSRHSLRDTLQAAG